MQIIKLADIVGNVENIKGLQEINFPVKVSYRLMRLANKLDPILKSFDSSRNAIIKELGTLGEDGNTTVQPENILEFQTKLGDLLETTEEIDFEPISIEDLGDVEVAPKLLVNWIFA